MFDCYTQKHEKHGGGEADRDEEKERQLSKLKEFGGTKQIIASLKTDQHVSCFFMIFFQRGLDPTNKLEMKLRKKRYDKNSKREIPPLSILALVMTPLVTDAVDIRAVRGRDSAAAPAGGHGLAGHRHLEGRDSEGMV